MNSMSMRRQLALAGSLIFVAFVAYHSFKPWKWSAQLVTPVGTATQYVSYECGPVWGTAYVHGSADAQYPLPSQPCGERREYQFVSGLDLLLGGAAIAVVLGWHRLHFVRERLL
jgi:hypothetical protein